MPSNVKPQPRKRSAGLVNNPHASNHRLTRNCRLLAALFFPVCLMAATTGARYVEGAALSQAGASNFTVVVGNPIHTEEGEKHSWQGQNFYPKLVTIDAGDTVTWKFDSGNEPHTVTFMGPVAGPLEAFIPDPESGPPAPGTPPKLIANPQVQLPQGSGSYDGSAFTSSGLVAADIPGPKEFKLSFPKPGTYQYICLLHAFPGPDGKLVGMTGTITVQEAGTAYPLTPEQVQAAAQKQKGEDLARARTLEAEMSGHVVAPTAMPDGSMKYHVEVGGMDMQNNLEYHRFTPKTLTIKQGDTVEWSMSMPGFHTVTFGAEPDLFTIEAQQAGPPKLVLNPQIFPSGGPVHTGTGYYNSGPMASPDQPPDPTTVTVYSLKFTKAGRYEYVCIPHYSLGMDATIIVEAAPAAADGTTKSASSPAGMPRTGSQADGLLPAAIGSLLLAVSGATLRLRSRRSDRIS